MPHALRFFNVAALLLLGTCFKSEAEQAINRVKTGYLDKDKSAPISKILEGYSFFTRTEWEMFETKQGKKIIEFRGHSPLAKDLPQRIAAIRQESGAGIARSGGTDILGMMGTTMTLDRLAKPDFTETTAALDLTVVFRAIPPSSWAGIGLSCRQSGGEGPPILEIRGRAWWASCFRQVSCADRM